jgi:O-antigen ligase
MLGGWLFLPHFDGRYKFLVLGSKASFVGAAVLLGSLVLDGNRWRTLRPRLLDLPIAVLCLGPFVASLYNGLGMNEAAAATFDSSMTWGAPYLLGRLYLGQPSALRDAADALVLAALVYVPFCLWEVRMSPQLHEALYGFRPFSFDQAYRWGGYRPSVFMQHGLAAGMFMASGTLVAYWLWRTGARLRIAGLPLGWASLLLALTTVLSKSTGAIILLAVGLAVLEGTRAFRTPLLLLTLMLVPAAYCTARISGWSGETLVTMSRDAIDEGRSQSIEFRLHNEDILIKKAMMRPWLGWGRYGRSFFLENEDGERETAVTDGYWVIIFGVRGGIGLVAIGVLLAAPVLALLRIYPGRAWRDARLAAPAAAAVMLLLWAVDDLFNAMPSPVYPAMAGALLSFVQYASTASTASVRNRRPAAAGRPGMALERSPGNRPGRRPGRAHIA